MTFRHPFRTGLVGLVPLALLLAACGSEAAQAPAPAASAAANTVFISADVVQGSTNIPAAQAPLLACVGSSRFARNSQIVWRSRVSDPVTGNLLDDKGVSKMTVKLATGKNLDAVYGLHPKNTGEGFWTASWIIPKDQPTGTLNYSITATTTDGRTGEFKPFSTATSLPAIIDQVLPDAPASPAAK